MVTEYLQQLNPTQRDAVVYNEGAQLVIAGAGSGKTRVLTYKIAYLMEHEGLEPWQILALTFTNKAAREMRQRIADLVGEAKAKRLWMGTFHSVFSRILRQEADKLGYTSDYTIYDQADSRNLIKTIIDEMGLDDKIYKAAAVQNHISLAKNRLLSPAQYRSDAQVLEADKACRIPLTGEIYERYSHRCQLSDVMDFDDLLYQTYRLFRDHPDVCARYAGRFSYVLVDEYQDTNYAQSSIVWQLAEHHQRVCVVGDDAQSIYSFRGANIDNILLFRNQYRHTRLFKLEQNYRSTQTIVKAANSLISYNADRIEKNVFSENDEGDPVEIYKAYSDIEEADIVSTRISAIHRREGVDYTDFAILYRTNSQSRSLEEALRRHAIPYRIYGGLSFYQRKEIKDTIAYFRLVVNPKDEEAFKRVINYPARGIGQTTQNKLAEAAIRDEVSLWDVALDPVAHGVDVNRGTQAKLSAFCALIDTFRDELLTGDAATVGMRIMEQSGIRREIFSHSEPDDRSRQENLEELANSLKQFVDDRIEQGDEAVGLGDFLQVVALLSDMDEDSGDDDRKVTLMTVHAAKGLEFRVVFVVGMEEELFPNRMAMDSVRGLEEERRLFYVALTRAEERCIITYAMSRYRFGSMEFGTPSRFLQELDHSCVLEHKSSPAPSSSASRESFAQSARSSWQRRPTGMADMESSSAPVRRVASVGGLRRLGVPSQRPASTGMSPSASVSAHPSSTQAAGGLQVGQTIEHERFGLGRVTSLEGVGENTKATVEFQHSGTKQLLLRFARFKVVE
ncbi:MAG: UvrD-helicase domain-containing protein [Clostridium sp.]|nr:UvrD-helicase domain-containing protein [Clostridium sp.]